jgi:hypothetical protein
VPFIIRWGPDASSDVLRQRARCTACGNLGATLQHPSWGGKTLGFCHSLRVAGANNAWTAFPAGYPTAKHVLLTFQYLND